MKKKELSRYDHILALQSWSLFEIISANVSESSHEEYRLELETINQTCQSNKLSNRTKNLCNDENECVDEKEDLSRDQRFGLSVLNFESKVYNMFNFALQWCQVCSKWFP